VTTRPSGTVLIGLGLILLSSSCDSTPRPSIQGDDHTVRRTDMVQSQLAARGIADTAVLRAMRSVPRHLFVPPGQREHAYEDRPLPIGYDQTISQPYIVGLMTQLIGPRKTLRVLEIGTGSGYQAAVLAAIVDTVYTIEIIRPLADAAARLLEDLGYSNVIVRCGDGYNGWMEKAPFDAIVVTAAPDHVPQPLIDQLGEGGRMVIPTGDVYGIQDLLLIRKVEGKIVRENIAPVRFVPLIRER
jgi:protein-L-isoaspartate(D-aspartate) O-methyltransferase